MANNVNISNCGTNVTVTQEATPTVNIVAGGLQGPTGPQGPAGPSGPTLALNYIIEYLNTRVTHESDTIISSTTVRFNEAAFKPIPSGFPALTKFDFEYFINGVLIPPSYVVSITEHTDSNPYSSGFSAGYGQIVNDFVDIVFDTNLLGFDLQTGTNPYSPGFNNGFNPASTGDLVVVIGKFNSDPYNSGFSNGFNPGYNLVSETTTLVFD